MECKDVICNLEKNWATKNPEIQEHISKCRKCQASLRAFELLMKDIKSDKVPPVPKNLKTSIMSQIAVEKTIFERILEFFTVRRLALTGVVAALLLLIVSSPVLFKNGSDSNTVLSPAGDNQLVSDAEKQGGVDELSNKMASKNKEDNYLKGISKGAESSATEETPAGADEKNSSRFVIKEGPNKGEILPLDHEINEDAAAIIVAFHDSATITFSPGSSFIPVADGIVLNRGEARVDIRKGMKHEFILRHGNISVIDIGTVYVARVQESRLTVEVEKGAVRVEARAGAKRIGEGQKAEFDTRTGICVAETTLRRGQTGENGSAGEGQVIDTGMQTPVTNVTNLTETLKNTTIDEQVTNKR